MKQMAKLAALGIAAIAACAILPADAATLTWTGAANNNLWCDADNWDAGGETIDFTAVNDYVFNATGEPSYWLETVGGMWYHIGVF